MSLQRRKSAIPPFLIVFFVLSAVAACGDDGGDGGPSKIEDLEIAETQTLSGLEGPVDVVIDDRGMVHIYAASEHDALMTQGYMMARDRIAQLIFSRPLAVEFRECASLSDTERGDGGFGHTG